MRQCLRNFRLTALHQALSKAERVAPPNGWKCPRNGEITARIDGGPPISFVEDLNRGDTAAVCGNSGNNGFFTVPWNWNVAGDGPHSIEFFDAGVSFATVNFEVATFGTEFLIGGSGECTISNFPDPGGDVTVSWDSAIQNFRITDIPTGPTQSPPDVAGVYSATFSFVEETCVLVSQFDPSGIIIAQLTVTQDQGDITIVDRSIDPPH